MTGTQYKENHYVPQWYQERFLPPSGQRVFQYLDSDAGANPHAVGAGLHKEGAASVGNSSLFQGNRFIYGQIWELSIDGN